MPPKGNPPVKKIGKKPSHSKKSPEAGSEEEDPQVPTVPLSNNNTTASENEGNYIKDVVDRIVLENSITAMLKKYKVDNDIPGKQRSVYKIQAAVENLTAIYQSSLQSDITEGRQKGRTARSRAAKKEKEDAEQSLRDRLKEIGDLLSSKTRAYEQINYMDAQGRLEDFYYYQIEGHRWKRIEKPEKRSKRVRRAYLLDFNQENSHHEFLHLMLDAYDDRHIGAIEYFQGYVDTFGNRIRDRGLGPAPPLVGPRELHWWAPITRQQPAGLGRRRGTEWRQRHWDLRLDDGAVERRRAEVERVVPADDQSHIMTHDTRRVNERDRYGRGTARPTTSNVRAEVINGGWQTVDHFHKDQTQSGLFIAAKESSWGWSTSYDCLGKVRTVRVPEVFSESCKPADDDDDLWVYDPSEEYNWGTEGLENGKRANSDAVTKQNFGELNSHGLTRPNEKADAPRGLRARLPKDVRKGAEKGKETPIETEQTPGTEEPPGPEYPAGKENTGEGIEANTTEQVNKGKTVKSKDVRTNLDYPYLKSEFTRASRGLRVGEERFEVTLWAEQTTGRRERHDYRVQAASSPCYSPPLLRTLPEIIDDGEIAAGFSLTTTPLETGSRQKCPHDPQRCRAWWTHSAADCWIAYPEQPTRPDIPVQWPILSIDAPKDSPNDYMPADGRDIYRARLRDHYGMFHQTRSEQNGHHWPRIGIRVPYAPMTFDDMRKSKTPVGADVTSKTSELGNMSGKATGIDHTPPVVRKGTKRPRENGEGPEGLDGRPTKKPKPTHEPESTNGGRIRATDASLRTAHELRSLAVPIIDTEGRWGWFPGDDVGPLDERPSEEPIDEGDYFSMEYQKISEEKRTSTSTDNADLYENPPLPRQAAGRSAEEPTVEPETN